MQLPSQLAPNGVTAAVRELCHRMCPAQRPEFAQVIREHWAIPFDCVRNVEIKVQECGGRMVLGWSIYEVPDLYLEARFHSVWHSPEGGLFEIAREDVTHEHILFVRDVLRHAGCAFVRHERLPLVDDPLLPAYWETVDDIRTCLEKFQRAGYEVRHPEMCQHLRPLVRQLQFLSEVQQPT